MQKITPFLWFDGKAEEAAKFYTSIFSNSKITGVTPGPNGTAMSVTFQLEGQDFQFVGAPNRFGIPAFFELHVWAWRDNPNGAYVDWNNNVSCEGQ